MTTQREAISSFVGASPGLRLYPQHWHKHNIHQRKTRLYIRQALTATDAMTLYDTLVVVGCLLLVSSPVQGRKYHRRC
ncbi:hypothetical protein LSAT2_015674 [Lamellibrachia satsuma]|nr:hypothetical protein LSAT2_015674 [Lamellibrachia satsuma]